MLDDNKEHVPDTLKSEVEEKISAVNLALASDEVAPIQEALDILQEALQKVGEEVYSKTGNVPPDPESTDAGSDPSDDAVEGEFREV